MERTALLLCLGDASWSPRTIRFADRLRKSGFRVTVASQLLTRTFDLDEHIALEHPPRPNGPLGRKLRSYGYLASFLPSVGGLCDRLNSYRHGLSGLAAALEKRRFDLIIVQDLALLPVVLVHRNGARVIFDAREYYPAQNEESRRFRIFERPERVRICARDLPRCDAVITVSQGLADAYARNFGVAPVVIHSATQFHDISPTPVEDGRIRLVYHGVANRNRGLTNLFELMKKLRPGFSLDLYLVTQDESRLAEMRVMAEADGRINLYPPVSFAQIVPELNRYDIGMIFYEPTSFNLRHCMPNKLFEFIQGRLAVAIGPSPDMATFLNEHGCGVVAKDFTIDSLADALNALTSDDVMVLKSNSAIAALKVSMERELDKLMAITALASTSQATDLGIS